LLSKGYIRKHHGEKHQQYNTENEKLPQTNPELPHTPSSRTTGIYFVVLYAGFGAGVKEILAGCGVLSQKTVVF
jgi:hypothetical protein